jgi:hypothetical protein
VDALVIRAKNHAGYCVEVRNEKHGWCRCSPIYATQGEAEHAMPKHKSLQPMLEFRTYVVLTEGNENV